MFFCVSYHILGTYDLVSSETPMILIQFDIEIGRGSTLAKAEALLFLKVSFGLPMCNQIGRWGCDSP